MYEGSPRVLFGSPVRQNPKILEQFLAGVHSMACAVPGTDYFLIDDNVEAKSGRLLEQFAKAHPNTLLINAKDTKRADICDEASHVWEEALIWKVGAFKNQMIDHAIKGGYDYLFLVDSDLVLHPKTLAHLLGLKKDIVSEVFWTKWEPDFPPLPQVWMSDQYNLYPVQRGEELTLEEISLRVGAFLESLKKPGVYPVGGLGACTLISRQALLSGVNFNEIYNVGFIGEDRHFCIRAAALGFRLYVDTNYPAYHIYRPSDLEGAIAFRAQLPDAEEEPSIRTL